MARKKQWNNGIAFSLGGLVLVASIATAATSVGPKVSFVRGATTTPSTSSVPTPALPAVQHLPTPTPVKAVYMTQCAVGTQSFRESLTKLIDTTELNAIVIDIRDYTGKIAFPTDNPVLQEYVSDECGARDMRAFVETLHGKNIYVIGRITVFQSPAYTKAHPD